MEGPRRPHPVGLRADHRRPRGSAAQPADAALHAPRDALPRGRDAPADDAERHDGHARAVDQGPAPVDVARVRVHGRRHRQADAPGGEEVRQDRPRLREDHDQGRGDADRRDVVRQRVVAQHAPRALRGAGEVPEVARGLPGAEAVHVPALLLRVEPRAALNPEPGQRPAPHAALLREGLRQRQPGDARPPGQGEDRRAEEHLGLGRGLAPRPNVLQHECERREPGSIDGFIWWRRGPGGGRAARAICSLAAARSGRGRRGAALLALSGGGAVRAGDARAPAPCRGARR